LNTLPKGTRVPRTALSSVISLLTKNLKFIVSWFDVAQKGEGKNKNNRLADIQFPARGIIIMILGSKIEKRFPMG